MTSITVMTMNIHKGFNSFNRRFVLTELREAVRYVGADIVFLQEVLGAHALHAKRIPHWPSQSHYEFVADTIWPNYAYGRNAVYPEGEHGNALLSKFPIVQHHNLDVSVAGDEKRGMLHSVVRTHNGTADLHAVCVHLGLNERHRRSQLRQLAAAVRNVIPSDAPLVVAGDFNDWRQQAHDYLLQHAGLKEVFVEAHGGAARTFPARWPLLRLDRIYLRNAQLSRPLALPRKPWSHLSDHVPLAAEIHL